MNAELLDLLVKVLTDAPQLPGANCTGRAALFDSADPHDQETAVALCATCPCLTGCETWFASLRPEQRPGTITAGQKPRKSPTKKRRAPRMNADEFPPHWLDELPDQPPDPVEPWRPTHRQRAHTIALLLAYISGETEFTDEFLQFCSRAYAEKSWPQHLLAVLEHFRVTAEGAQGHDLTVARLAADLAAANNDHWEFGSGS